MSQHVEESIKRSLNAHSGLCATRAKMYRTDSDIAPRHFAAFDWCPFIVHYAVSGHSTAK